MMSSFPGAVRDDSPPVPPFRGDFELFPRPGIEIRLIIWKEAVDLEGMLLWPSDTRNEDTETGLIACELGESRRRNGALKATKESRLIAQEVSREERKTITIPNTIGPRRLAISNECIFLLPWVYKSAIHRSESIDELRGFKDAEIMNNVLVLLEDADDSLEVMKGELPDNKSVARSLWGIFPDVASGRYRYSILVDEYRDVKFFILINGGTTYAIPC